MGAVAGRICTYFRCQEALGHLPVVSLTGDIYPLTFQERVLAITLLPAQLECFEPCPFSLRLPFLATQLHSSSTFPITVFLPCFTLPFPRIYGKGLTEAGVDVRMHTHTDAVACRRGSCSLLDGGSGVIACAQACENRAA